MRRPNLPQSRTGLYTWNVECVQPQVTATPDGFPSVALVYKYTHYRLLALLVVPFEPQATAHLPGLRIKIVPSFGRQALNLPVAPPSLPPHSSPFSDGMPLYRTSEGPAGGARAYLEAPPPGVVLCANRLGSRREVEEAAVHELVHAYDFLVAGLPLQECQSLAYRYV